MIEALVAFAVLGILLYAFGGVLCGAWCDATGCVRPMCEGAWGLGTGGCRWMCSP